jgi:hypothetical protein
MLSSLLHAIVVSSFFFLFHIPARVRAFHDGYDDK